MDDDAEPTVQVDGDATEVTAALMESVIETLDAQPVIIEVESANEVVMDVITAVDVAEQEEVSAVDGTLVDVVGSSLDETAGVELVSDNNLVFVEEDVLIADGADDLLAQQYIETTEQYGGDHQSVHSDQQMTTYFEAQLPDNQNQNVPVSAVVNADQDQEAEDAEDSQNDDEPVLHIVEHDQSVQEVVELDELELMDQQLVQQDVEQQSVLQNQPEELVVEHVEPDQHVEEQVEPVQYVAEQEAAPIQYIIDHEESDEQVVEQHQEDVQEAQQIQNEMNNVQVMEENVEHGGDDDGDGAGEQHQQLEDVSPSSDSVEQFGSRQADQELQVVPDSSTTAVDPDRSRFQNENLHESMDLLMDRQSPPTMSALGVQMVPTSSEQSNNADVQSIAFHEEFDAIEADDDQRRRRRQAEQNNDENAGEQQVASVHEHVAHNVDITSESDLRQTVPVCDSPAGVTITAGDVAVASDHVHHQASISDDQQQQDALYAFQGNEQTYEVCVTLPTTDDQNTESEMHEIPIDISDWTDLGGQSLVAVAEDGTRIPLTVVRHGPDGQITYDTSDGSNDVQHILQQLSGSAIPVMHELTEAQGSEGSVMLNVAEDQSTDHHQTVTVTNLVENSILPDDCSGEGDGVVVVDEQSLQHTNVIHIPDDQAFMASEVIKVQMTKDKPLKKVTAPRKPKRSQPAVRRTRGPSAQRNLMTINEQLPPPPPPPEPTTTLPAQSISQSSGDVDMVVELSNTTPSAISPENMQALIQILQSLPATARGQTIQIILQTDPAPKTDAVANTTVSSDQPSTSVATTTSASLSVPFVQTSSSGDGDRMRFVQKVLQKRSSRVRKTKTSDIAIQVNPEFIDSAQTEVLPAEMNQTEEASIPQTDVGTEVAISVPPKETAAVTTTAATMDQASAMSEDERSKQIMAALMESSRKRRAYRKKNSKQIVTVEEQWVTDPKPGVSYYAVVDYLSELDQDGFSSASEMKRPEAMSSGFMEDYLELQSVTADIGDELPKNRSVLESTVDSSVIASPFRRSTASTKLKQLPAAVAAAAAAAALSSSTSGAIDLPASLDESVVTLQEKNFDQLELDAPDEEEEAIAEGDEDADGDGDYDINNKKKKRKLKRLKKKQSGPRKAASRASAVRYEHKCGYCGYDSADKILVVEHCLVTHPDFPVKTLSLMSQTIGRTCPYCHQHFEHTEFFAHMRFAHSEVHPYKCGYCDFMGRDRNQIRHHVQKKHRLPVKVIHLLDPSRSTNQGDEASSENHQQQSRRHHVSSNAISEGEESVYEYRTDEEEMDELGEEDAAAGDARRGLSCPECKKTFKTLKYLKTHIKVHQTHRYQCGYCDFISIMLHQVLRHCQKKHGDVVPKVLTKELEPDKNPIVSRDMDDVIKKVFSLNTRLPRDPDQTKWMRKWFCPHCDYTCQFGASYRRHLRMHANILPYKCNYCSFKGREKYYVRRHISRMHPDLPGIVVENNPENCARDTSSDEDFQEKGLRRKRRRKAKESLHAVVRLEDMDPDSLQDHYQQQPIREKKGGSSRWTSDADSDVEQAQKIPRPPLSEAKRASTTAAVAMSLRPTSDHDHDETDADTIVCKACQQKVAVKIFQQHANQHFKKIVPFKCAYCNYMSVKNANIRTHSERKHANLPFKTEECHLASLAPRDFVTLIGGEDQVTVDDDPPKFTCPLCQSLVDYDERILSDHFYAHFEYYPYRCSECEHQNVSEEKVREHGIVHAAPFVVYRTDQEKPEGLEDTIQQFLQEGQQIVQTKLMELMNQQAGLIDDNEPGVVDNSKTCEQPANNNHGDVEAEINVSHVFLCPICDLQMDMKAALVRRHLYDHYSYKPFKCGHCRFVGPSKTVVRSHSANKHRDAANVIVDVVDKLMPEGLAKMLREIDKQLKVIQSEKIVDDDHQTLLRSSEPVSAEGKVWMEKLSRGVCPWCEVPADQLPLTSKVDDGADNRLRLHLFNHFGGKQQFVCEHCGQLFPRKREATQHIVADHPGSEIRLSEQIDEDSIRRGLRFFMDSRRLAAVVDSSQDKVEKKSDKAEVIDSVADDGQVKPADQDSEDGDNDIVTVEGVLLTRTFRSETEASDDDDDDNYEYESDSEDSDFLIGDLDSNLVDDMMAIINRTHPFGHSNVAVHSGPVFVCGYCDFFSQDQDVTKAHTEENHADEGRSPGAALNKAPTAATPKRKVRCRGGAVKRQAITTRGSPLQKTRRLQQPKVKRDDEEEEQETLENIVKMVQSAEPERIDASQQMEDKDVSVDLIDGDHCHRIVEVAQLEPEEETLENIIRLVQQNGNNDDQDFSKENELLKEKSEEIHQCSDEIAQLVQPEEETVENIIKMVQYQEEERLGSKDTA